MTGKRTIWVVGIIAAAALFFGFRWFTDGGSDAPSYRQVNVERGDIRLSVLATGVVQPQNRLEIKPPIGGRMEDVLVKEGQPVKRGALLAWMSSTERAALLDAARAKGPSEVAHWEDLYKPTPLVAPLEGVVIARNVEPGQTVTGNDAVLVMSDRLIVKASVDETDIGQVRVGQRAAITLDAYPKESVEAHVDHIAYEAKTTNNVTTYEVDVVVDDIPDVMRSGMTANVTFFLDEKEDVLILPAEGISQKEGGATVLTQNPSGGKPVSRPVQLGLSDGKKTEIMEGLKEGDVVLVPTVQIPHSGSGPRNPFAPSRQNRSRQGQEGRRSQ